MSDGAISVKLAPDYEMGEVQQQLNDYDTSDDIISNDGFFPDMSLSQFRNQYRADGTITTQRLQDALIEGMEVSMQNSPRLKRKANATV